MKKRLIVISIWGSAIDFGYMGTEEIKKEKQKMADCHKYIPGDSVRTFFRTNEIDDLVILCWQQEKVK